ncbi:hypothetical protein SprV_1002845300 [Sparganum proliferum]
MHFQFRYFCAGALQQVLALEANALHLQLCEYGLLLVSVRPPQFGLLNALCCAPTHNLKPEGSVWLSTNQSYSKGPINCRD